MELEKGRGIIDYRVEYNHLENKLSKFIMFVKLIGCYNILNEEDVEALQDIVIYLGRNLDEISKIEFLKLIEMFVSTEEETEFLVQLWN